VTDGRLHRPGGATIITAGRRPTGHSPGYRHMTTRPTARLAAALFVPAVLFAACGGSAASGAPVVPSTGIVLPSGVIPSDFALPSDLAIPSFDIGSLVTNLENVDSYRVTIAGADGLAYSGTVVTKPTVSRDLVMGSGDSATHIVTIGDEAWMGTGDGPLQSAPAAMVGGLIPLFDPMVLLGAFGGLSMTEYADNLGEEQKNGQNTTHYKVELSSLPNFAQLGMPDGATVETWVADDGYLVSFIATDFGEVGKTLGIDVTNVNDPANVVERPN